MYSFGDIGPKLSGSRVNSISDACAELSRRRMYRIGDWHRASSLGNACAKLAGCGMYSFGDISPKLPGSRVNGIGDACAELSRSRVHRIRNIGVELARWLSGRRWRGLCGRGRFLAKIALSGEFPPIGHGECGRLLCHGVSSILIPAELCSNLWWNIQHGYRGTGAKQRQLALQRFDADETECQRSSHAW